MQCDAVIFRNPRQQQLYSALNFGFFIYLGRLLKFTAAFDTNEKRHTQGFVRKKLSNDLAVTSLHLSCFLIPSFYGRQRGRLHIGKMFMLLRMSNKAVLAQPSSWITYAIGSNAFFALH